MGHCTSKQQPAVEPALPPTASIRPADAALNDQAPAPEVRRSSNVLVDVVLSDQDDAPISSGRDSSATSGANAAMDSDECAEPEREMSPTASLKKMPSTRRVRREPSMNRPVRSSNVRRMFGQLKNFQREVHDVFDNSPDKFVTFHSYEYDDLRPYEADHWIEADDITVDAQLPSSSMIAERGRLRDGRTVFLRRLNKNASSYKLSRSRRLLVAEVRLTSRLTHPNIVQFVGFNITSATGLVCISEYVDGHSLQTALAVPSTAASMTWRGLSMRYSVQLCSALVYMHSLQVVHGNLKSDHLYINTKQHELKVSGFGFSLQSSTTHKSQNVWNAPEVLQGLPMTQKVDIYSMGVVLMEMDTRRAPFADEQASMKIHDLLLRITTGSIRPTLSRDCPDQLRHIIQACIQYPPENRPTAEWVLLELQQAQIELDDAPAPTDGVQ
ncbi:serine/threonine protein kinase [Aphanomyces invadans]|uniref:Serine/threonine protein kinase n=1 Tax=Aphanomyces invadans TaxID=157072 RepID=A0A024TCI0_9STRA|nr:serine/threonine protein kinase [Aphanomyces invadans]ETV91042.1 serine/threonine protein kinase [Aphanomyces invadans]RHY29631.1 hypothetical protein DYB32_004997 [Aphanomyces invadans]|eukprot:XP_008880322.1 serine/threonine protein kinase [Aphanomyces invadans]